MEMIDIFFFSCILISVAVGWLFGYFRGVVNGYEYKASLEADEYPVVNVYFYETEHEDKFNFVEMLSGTFIMQGTFDEVIEKLKKNNTSKLIVFSAGQKDE